MAVRSVVPSRRSSLGAGHRGGAEVFCYGIALHHRPATEKRVTMFVGSYDFTLERAGGDWRVSGFRFNVKFVE